jgi:phosphoribosyl 1,2-cyclic phosphodiesterase
MALGAIASIHTFSAGETVRIGDVSVETVPTAHDAADGVAFVVCAEGLRLGILTDLGHVFDPLPSLLSTLDAVFLESNYDPTMLAGGAYPAWLQRRIRGPRGHLSNAECASLLSIGAAHRLRWACLAHLSAENNRPDVALRAHRDLIRAGLPLHVASRAGSTPLFEV